MDEGQSEYKLVPVGGEAAVGGALGLRGRKSGNFEFYRKTIMLYLSSFKLSENTVRNPNLYPYNVFKGNEGYTFVFSPITVLYGNNGSGKSTLLNIMADKLDLKGKESVTTEYYVKYITECGYDLADDENTGRRIRKLPENSRYIKSEDVLYEVKKIQNKELLGEGMLCELVKKGLSKEAAEAYMSSDEGQRQKGYRIFAQEKYSNGETSLQYFQDYILPEAVYLLDEPEVSLSPANQLALADEINRMTRLLGCQFVIATHSPFMLGTLDAVIYNLDTRDYDICKWSELENVRYFYEFFKHRENEFM